MKYLLCIFLVIVLTTTAQALVINEFTVDPQQDWDNSNSVSTNDEYIELYNEGNEINLSNYRLELIDSTNETQELTGLISKEGYFLIQNPTGQQNNVGIIQLFAGSNLIDEINYTNGNSDSIDNECLIRIPNGFDSNNITDFKKGKCTRGYSNDIKKGNSASLILEATVSKVDISIESIIIGPDDLEESGFQIMPAPGSNKEIMINVTTKGNIQNVVASIQNSNFISTFTLTKFNSSLYIGKTNLSYFEKPANYSVTINITDIQGFSSFEYLSSIGIELDASKLTFSDLTPGNTYNLSGDKNFNTKDLPTIKNIGNVKIDTEIKGSDLESGNNTISVANIFYRFGNLAYLELSTDPVITKINLDLLGTTNFDLQLFIPTLINPGTYTGPIVLTALQ